MRHSEGWEEDIIKELKEGFSEEARKRGTVRSRRSILKASAALLVGGITGNMSDAFSAPAATSSPAPPLPWPWAKLDPLEAGTQAYPCLEDLATLHLDVLAAQKGYRSSVPNPWTT